MQAHELIANWVDMNDLEWTFVTPSLNTLHMMNYYVNRIMKHPETGIMVNPEDVFMEERLFHPMIAIQETDLAIAQFIDDLFEVMHDVDVAWTEASYDIQPDWCEP